MWARSEVIRKWDSYFWLSQNYFFRMKFLHSSIQLFIQKFSKLHKFMQNLWSKIRFRIFRLVIFRNRLPRIPSQTQELCEITRKYKIIRLSDRNELKIEYYFILPEYSFSTDTFISFDRIFDVAICFFLRIASKITHQTSWKKVIISLIIIYWISFEIGEKK